MDTPRSDFWTLSLPPCSLVPLTITEKLTNEEVATNNTVLAHLKTKAAKQKAAKIQKAPPPSLLDPIHLEDDTLLFTPTQTSKFPPVHGYMSTWIFDNLNYKQMSVWLTLKSPHIFVQPLCHRYYPPNIAPEMVHLIHKAIQLALGTMGIRVTMPSPNEQVTKRNKAPFPNLKTQPTNYNWVQDILQTLEGHKLELSTSTGSKWACFNLYIQSLTKDNDDWAHLLEAVTNTIYKHALLGNGFHGPSWNCYTCNGVNHPSSLCPFPLFSGWFKAGIPKAITDFHTSVSQDISHKAAAECAQPHDTNHEWGTPCC